MDFAAARAELVAQLSAEISDKRVLTAMSHVPRELFVPRESRNRAYADVPLPIGQGQTISQPCIIAIMTQALSLSGAEKVLEVGTGSGYQTAVLAELARSVVSVERVPELLERAQRTLDSLKYGNIELHPAGATLGWEPSAPYDAVIVTAGAPRIPEDLYNQLAVGGRMVVPTGSLYAQELYKVTRREDGKRVESLGACRFVPLVGKGAWEERGD